MLMSIDEGLDPSETGSLTSYNLSGNKHALEFANFLPILKGGVSSVLYLAVRGWFMAVAHYETSALTTYALFNDTSHLPELRETHRFALSTPGTDPARQEAPHPHQVLLDPTRSFILVPDLGADEVRIFRILSDGGLAACDSLPTQLGVGPRHAAFYSPVEEPRRYWMYVVNELANSVTAFEVHYGERETAVDDQQVMTFRECQSVSTFGPEEVPKGALAAEIRIEVRISMDSRVALDLLVHTHAHARSLLIHGVQGDHLLVSNRTPGVSMSAEGRNGDVIAVFSIGLPESSDGHITFKTLLNVDGFQPRSFDMDHSGRLLVIGLAGKVAVFERGEGRSRADNWDKFVKVAEWGLLCEAGVDLGSVTCVVWNN